MGVGAKLLMIFPCKWRIHESDLVFFLMCVDVRWCLKNTRIDQKKDSKHNLVNDIFLQFKDS